MKGDPFYMTTRYHGYCANCSVGIAAGEQVVYAPNGKRVFCTKKSPKQGCGDKIMANLAAQPRT